MKVYGKFMENFFFFELIMNKYDYLDIKKTNLKESAVKLGLGVQLFFNRAATRTHSRNNEAAATV